MRRMASLWVLIPPTSSRARRIAPAWERRSAPGLQHSSRGESTPPPPCRFRAAGDSRSTSTMNGSARRVSYFLRSRAQNAGDQRRHAVPPLRLSLESTPPARSDGRTSPCACCPIRPTRWRSTLVLQPVERWVQRSLLDLQPFIGNLLNAQQNAVAMQRASDTALRISMSRLPATDPSVYHVLSSNI